LLFSEFLTVINKEETVSVFIDGACSGNPGPGGWGGIAKQGNYDAEISGGENNTTNNRMELLAAIKVLSLLESCNNILITTDSQYLKNGIEKWIVQWKKNGWKTADKSPVKNQDLWVELDNICQGKRISWAWVKGHNGNPDNERADVLATHAVMKIIINN
jgi:ribonuclease HI